MSILNLFNKVEEKVEQEVKVVDPGMNKYVQAISKTVIK